MNLTDKLRSIGELVVLCAFVYTFLYISEIYGGEPSRRMANLPYVLWIVRNYAQLSLYIHSSLFSAGIPIGISPCAIYCNRVASSLYIIDEISVISLG